MSFKSFDALLYAFFSVVLTLYLFSPVCSYTAGNPIDLSFLTQYVCPPQQPPTSSTLTSCFYVALGVLSGAGVGYLFTRSRFSFAMELEKTIKKATEISASDIESQKKLLLGGNIVDDTNAALKILGKRLDIEKSVVDYLQVPLKEHQSAVSVFNEGTKRFLLDEIKPVSEIKGLPEPALTRLFHVKTVEDLAAVSPQVG